jgi:D-3-phosphoglycerate dehydrogenase
MDTRPLVIGDSYFPAEVLAAAYAARGVEVDHVTVRPVEATWPLDGVSESEGDPAEVAELIRGRAVVAVHGAPLTRQVFEASPGLRLIGCARGGPVNIDLAAAREHEVLVTLSPGKNAAAVADYTIGAIVSAVRRIPASAREVLDAARSGGAIAESTFEGARWFSRELAGTTLGLVGLGRVGALVARLASGLGMSVAAFDPYVQTPPPGVELVGDLDALLTRSQVLSLHARATPGNRHLIGARELGLLPPGALIVNSARESLLDEHALLAALRSGGLGGAALDVVEPDGPWRELAEDPRVVLTPHIAGATVETLRRGAEMIAEDAAAFLAGREPRWIV